MGEAASAGEISADDLRAVEDDCIREIVEIQEEIGLEERNSGGADWLERNSWLAVVSV